MVQKKGTQLKKTSKLGTHGFRDTRNALAKLPSLPESRLVEEPVNLVEIFPDTTKDLLLSPRVTFYTMFRVTEEDVYSREIDEFGELYPDEWLDTEEVDNRVFYCPHCSREFDDEIMLCRHIVQRWLEGDRHGF